MNAQILGVSYHKSVKALAIVSIGVMGCAFAQTPPKIGPAQAVDIRVRSTDWQPRGQALLYSRDEDSGIGIGLYCPGDAEGKVVLHLGKDDQWSDDWFDGSTSALVTVYKHVLAVEGAGKEADVYLLDATHKTSYEVFSKTVFKPDDISVDSDLSPALNHAVVTVTEGKKTYHMVLPINGGRLVDSPDIDQALAEGFSGPTWSADGTAIYGKGGGNGTINLPIRISGNQGQATADGNSGSLVLQLSGELKISQGAGSSFILKLVPPSPPAGSPVLEVVPANGVLRPVRSPGPWVDQPKPLVALRPADGQSWLEFKTMRGSAHSLWLVRAKPRSVRSSGNVFILSGSTQNGGASQPETSNTADLGVLVAANADSSDLAPDGRSIAYITDGALFIRRIEE